MDIGHAPQNEPDTQATDSRRTLQSFCDNGFDGSLSACAVALGRTREELAEMLREGAVIDDDLLMKIRGVADERGIEI